MACDRNARGCSNAARRNGIWGQASRYLNTIGSWNTYRDLKSFDQIPERLAQYAYRLGIDAEELAELSRPRRRRERPNRDALMYLLWREGHFRLAQIGPHFGVSYAAISQACRRAEHRLKTDPSFQRMLEAVAENNL